MCLRCNLLGDRKILKKEGIRKKMGKRKLMTISDLYNFCLKNNFCHFSSSADNEEIYVQLPATFESEENFDKDKEGLIPFVAKAYHDHINLNKSEIKPETLESTLPSAMLRPILASIVIDEETGEKDFGSHDCVFEEDEDGNEIIRYIEQPIGVIFGDNTIEYDKEDDVNRAILHGYLYDGYCQDAVDIMNRRKTVDCSVELSIREMSFNAADKVLTLEDFYVSGLTLLGSKIAPGMKGSKVTIEDFCEKDNSMFTQDEETHNKLVETLEKLEKKIDNLSNFNINKNNQAKNAEYENQRKEDENVENENTIEVKEDVTETEEVEVTETEESTEEVTDAATESESEETVETPEVVEETDEEVQTDNVVVTEDNTDVKTEGFEENTNTTTEKYSKTFELSHDDIRSAIYALLTPYEETDNDWYWITEVYDDRFIYQGCRGNYFGQKYTKQGDNVAFDGERYELYAEFVTASEKAELESMRSNYAELKQFKADTENAQLHSQREAILTDAKYAVLTEKEADAEGNEKYKNEAYAKLVSEMDNYSLTDLEKELKSVFADYITNGGQFAYKADKEDKPVVTKKMFASSTKKTPSRYGNLFGK